MKLNSIMVLRPGQSITLTDGISAIIDEVSIGASGRIQYLCVWWAGRERKREWINDFEIRRSVSAGDYISIGFQ